MAFYFKTSLNSVLKQSPPCLLSLQKELFHIQMHIIFSILFFFVSSQKQRIQLTPKWLFLIWSQLREWAIPPKTRYIRISRRFMSFNTTEVPISVQLAHSDLEGYTKLYINIMIYSRKTDHRWIPSSLMGHVELCFSSTIWTIFCMIYTCLCNINSKL